MNVCKRAIVRVWRKQENNDSFLGSAFLVNEKQLLTAEHVLTDENNNPIPMGQIYLAGPAWGGIRQVCEVSRTDRDVALLEIPYAESETPWIPLANSGPQVGDKVIVAGYSSEDNDPDTPELQIHSYDGSCNTFAATSYIAPGMSGAAVLRNGLLVGIAYARDTDKNRAYIIPLDEFRDLVTIPDGSSDGFAKRRPKIDLSRLPTPSVNRVFGRDIELEELNNCLAAGNISVATVVSFAEFSKTALIDTFLNQIAPAFQDADMVFAWHFYSQERQNETVANSSLFFDTALQFWGYRDVLPAHDNEKALRLAELLRTRKSILVLDGIEPLQHSPQFNHGCFNDKAMQILLTELARNGLTNGGLVIVSSRQALTELERFSGAKTIAVKKLDRVAGTRFLRYLGVEGDAPDLSATVDEYKGHPLSLALLGNLLVTDYHRDITQRRHIDITNDDDEHEHISSILEYYEREWDVGSPERVLLYLLSLFNRPTHDPEFQRLRRDADFARPLKQLPQNRLNRVIHYLRQSGLLIRSEACYDCHSLIRREAAKRFSKNHPNEFRQAHEVLFEYFRQAAPCEFPKDLQGMEPLYRAIEHGCLAQRFEEALEIYWDRISRKRQFFSQKQLGAYSSDLFAISQFFPDGLQAAVTDKLCFEKQGWLQSVAAFLLSSSARIQEAIAPRKAGIRASVKLGNWRLAAGDSRNFASVLLTIGYLDEALAEAERAIEYSNNFDLAGIAGQFSKDIDSRFLAVSCQSRKATVLHRLGRLDESLACFQEAEEKYGRPLDRANGFYFCALLLYLAQADNELKAILKRGREAYQISTRQSSLDNIGDDRLTIAMATARLGNGNTARSDFDRAVDFIRQSGRLEKLPPALIDRALFYLYLWKQENANDFLMVCHEDLNQAERLIEMSGMNLYQQDLNFVKACLDLAQDNHSEAKLKLDKTRQAASEMHYGHMIQKVDTIMKQIQTP